MAAPAEAETWQTACGGRHWVKGLVRHASGNQSNRQPQPRRDPRTPVRPERRYPSSCPTGRKKVRSKTPDEMKRPTTQRQLLAPFRKVRQFVSKLSCVHLCRTKGLTGAAPKTLEVQTGRARSVQCRPRVGRERHSVFAT